MSKNVLDTLTEHFGDEMGRQLVVLYLHAGDTLADPDATPAAIAKAQAIRDNCEATADSLHISARVKAQLTAGDVLRFLGQIIPAVLADGSTDTDPDEQPE
jgi:hypothetical protein